MFIYDHLHQYVDLHFPSKYLHHYLEPYFRNNRTYFRSRFMLFGPQIKCVIFLNSCFRLAPRMGVLVTSEMVYLVSETSNKLEKDGIDIVSYQVGNAMPCGTFLDCGLMPLSCEDMSYLKKGFFKYRWFSY